LKKTDKTERVTTALEAEPHGYRHFCNTIVRKPVTLNTNQLRNFQSQDKSCKEIINQ